jgi:hypothetical protein
VRRDGSVAVPCWYSEKAKYLNILMEQSLKDVCSARRRGCRENTQKAA